MFLQSKHDEKKVREKKKTFRSSMVQKLGKKEPQVKKTSY